MIYKLFCLLLCLVIFTAKAQYNQPSFEKSLAPIAGIRGISNPFVELGISSQNIGDKLVGKSLSALSNLNFNNNHIVGASACYFAAFDFFEIAGSATLYSNFSDYNFILKPHIGFGAGGYAMVTYGYNIALLNNFDAMLNRHELGLILRFPRGATNQKNPLPAKGL